MKFKTEKANQFYAEMFAIARQHMDNHLREIEEIRGTTVERMNLKLANSAVYFDNIAGIVKACQMVDVTELQNSVMEIPEPDFSKRGN